MVEVGRLEIAISQVTVGEYAQFLQELDLSCDYFQLEVNPSGKHNTPKFKWSRGTEVQHSVDYMNWLNNYIQVPADLQFYKASNNSSLLDTALMDRRYILKGTTDVVVTEKNYVRVMDAERGMRVTIELKMEVKQGHQRQAILQLIAANMRSKYPVIALLTDLRETWLFYWLSLDGDTVKIQECLLDLPHGIAFVEAYLKGVTELNNCTMREYFASRCEPVSRNNSAGEGQAVQHDPSKITKLNLMDYLPAPEVGDMSDFLDEMSHTEAARWKTRHAIDCFFKTRPEDYLGMYA